MPSETLRVGRDITVDERKAAVLQAALICIAAMGYENVRWRDVARETGISIGALQHYFISRDDLLAQAFAQASRDLLNDWAAALSAELPPWARIEALIDSVVNRDRLRERCCVWVDFAAAAARNERIRLAFGEVYDQWGHVVGAAIDDGCTSGDFRLRLAKDLVVELILEQLDGGILSIASGLGSPDGSQLHDAALALAGLLLDYAAPAETA
jgi:AcrR family transcriptional regulator